MKNKVTWLALMVSVVGLLVFSSCSNSSSPTSSYGSGSGGSSSGGSGSGGNPSPGTVNMTYTSFTPSNLSVAKGSTVTWMNQDGITHTTTSDAGDWDLSVPSGASKTVTFNTAGTFKYHCSIHSYMTGTIVVQ
jgi:plastocyanin